MADLLNLPGYVLLSRLGSGGMGSVWKATQAATGRSVAVKVLHSEYTERHNYIERFFREIRTAMALNHPNIVKGIEAGESRGHYYFVMEFVDGESLLDLLKRRGTLDERTALQIALQVARAIDYAWQNGFLHRDIKPQNILVTREGVAKLADLGIAKYQEDAALTTEGLTIGSPHYISPERARGKSNLDVRSDLYSLGATLFHVLTGRPMFGEGSGPEILAKHVTTTPPDPRSLRRDLSSNTAEMLLRLVQKDPEKRYASARQVAEDIEAMLRGDRPPNLHGGTVRLREAAAARRPLVQPPPPKRSVLAPILWIVTLVAVGVGVYFVATLPRNSTTLVAKPEEPVAPKPSDEIPTRVRLLLNSNQVEEAYTLLRANKETLSAAEYERLSEQILQPLAEKRLKELNVTLQPMIAQGSFDAALNECRARIDQAGDNRYLRERLSDRLKDLEDQRDRAARSHSTHVGNEAEVLLKNAQAKFDEGSVVEATREASKLIAANPEYEEAHLLLARCHLRQNAFDLALDSVGRVLSRHASAPALALRGEILLKQDKPAEASAAFTESLRQDSKQWSVLFLLATCAVKLGQRDLALLDCEQALTINPKCAEARRLRADIFRQVGNWDRVIEELGELIVAAPDKMAWYERALAYIQLKNFEAAAADLKSALQQAPEFAEASARLAECEQAIQQGGKPSMGVFSLFDGKTRGDWTQEDNLSVAIRDSAFTVRPEKSGIGLALSEVELKGDFTLHASLRGTYNFRGRQEKLISEFVGIALGFKRLSGYLVVGLSGNHISVDRYTESRDGRRIEPVGPPSQVTLDLSKWMDLTIAVSEGKLRVLINGRPLHEADYEAQDIRGRLGIVSGTSCTVQFRTIEIIAPTAPEKREAVRYEKSSAAAWTKQGEWGEGKEGPIAEPMNKDDRGTSTLTRTLSWKTFELECEASATVEGPGYAFAFFSAFDRDCALAIGRDKQSKETFAIGVFGTYKGRHTFVNHDFHFIDKPTDLTLRSFNVYRIVVWPDRIEFFANGKRLLSESKAGFLEKVDRVREEALKRNVVLSANGFGFGAWDMNHADRLSVKAQFKSFVVRPLR